MPGNYGNRRRCVAATFDLSASNDKVTQSVQHMQVTK